jgi:hypothetical protein
MVWAHTTRLTPTLFIEVSIPSQDARSCTYVFTMLEVSNLSLFLRYFGRILELFKQRGMLWLYFYCSLKIIKYTMQLLLLHDIFFDKIQVLRVPHCMQ